MNNLADKFIATLHCMEELKQPLFYNSTWGIRFALGDEEQNSYDSNGVNPEYTDGALYRATEIYNACGGFDLLRFDCCEQNPGKIREIFSTIAGLSSPQQQHTKVVYEYEYMERNKQTQMYWDLAGCGFAAENLLREIILADLGGHSWLASSVYFANTKTNLIYHPYDDRGADLVAADRATLCPFYDKFNDWILEFDRSRIDKMFTEK